MASIETVISGLTDERAIGLMNRFVRALYGLTASERSGVELAASIGAALSLPDDAIDAPSAGQIARSVLMLLAGSPLHQDGIAALINMPPMASFTPVGTSIEPFEILEVLQAQYQALDPAPTQPSASVKDTTTQIDLLQVVQGLIAHAGLRQTGPKADAQYQVWYATTRRPVNAVDPTLGYGVDRDDCVHYGACTVFVPKSHKIGSVGSPWWKRVVTLTDDRLRLHAIERLAEDSFWKDVANQLEKTPAEEQDAVVFVHGFNVDFQEAALRAAQIGFDMQVKGAMAFFSWASRGELGKYLADEAAVELDEIVIADFLCDFALKSGARRVHVIAHSMGNRAVLRAVDRIARDAERRAGVRFGQFILAAPDIDTRKFHQLCSAYQILSERTTLYVSSRDLAVETSQWLHDFPRVGLLPPVTVADGIDTVNVVNVDLTVLGHGYVAEARSVLSDMHSLIRYGAAPQSRFGVQATTTEQGQSYWLIGA